MFQKQSNQQVQKLNIKLTFRFKNASYMLAFLFLDQELHLKSAVGWVERSETQHRAISYQLSAVSDQPLGVGVWCCVTLSRRL
jgi:Ni,Fe-hydrogenase III component G